jgi:hypothetical protein
MFLRNVGSYKSHKAYILEDGNLRNQRCENLKSYIALTGWALKQRRIVFSFRYELGFISQKMTFFIFTAVKTSNLTLH